MCENGPEDPMRPHCCGARTRAGGRCGQLAMPNGRCRFHGGLSTGPRTVEGLERLRAARTIHGERSADGVRLRRMVRDLRRRARRTCEAV